MTISNMHTNIRYIIIRCLAPCWAGVSWALASVRSWVLASHDNLQDYCSYVSSLPLVSVMKNRAPSPRLPAPRWWGTAVLHRRSYAKGRIYCSSCDMIDVPRGEGRHHLRGFKGRKRKICFLPFIDKIDLKCKNYIAYSAIAPNISMHAKNQINQ